MNGYFVTGTDTNVGKTYVTCALARFAVAGGHRVFAFKPVETGCAAGPDGRLVGSDQDQLVSAAGGWQTGPLRGLYQLPVPAAPLVAAEDAGVTLDLELIVRTARTASAERRASFVLIEGAGGWRVPITPSADMSVLARQLALPVIVVARASLGTINHTLLTLEAIESDGLSVAAVVLSQRPEDDPAAAERNQYEVQRRWQGLILRLAGTPSALGRLVPTVPRET